MALQIIVGLFCLCYTIININYYKRDHLWHITHMNFLEEEKMCQNGEKLIKKSTIIKND